MDALHGIAHAALGDLTLDQLLARIVSVIREEFSFEYVGVARIEWSCQEAVLVAFSTDLPTSLTVGFRQSVQTGIVGHVARTGKTRFEPEARRSTDYVPTFPDICAELCVPIIQDDVVVGVLNAETASADSLLGQTSFLETVGDLAAGAFAAEESRMRVRRQADLLAITNAVSRLAMEAERLDDMLRRTVNYIADRLDVTVASILMLDDTGERFAYEVCAGQLDLSVPDDWPIGVGVAGRCARTGKPQLVDDLLNDPDYLPGHADVQSEYLVPIAWRGRVLGVLNLESTSADTFTPELQRVFEGIADQVAGLIHLLAVRRDLEATNSALEQLSHVDGLTGLANRRQFNRSLAEMWDSQTGLTLAMVDVDHFKALNDEHGHLAGDDQLRTVAATISQMSAFPGWLAARYGGEEFAVLVPKQLNHDVVAAMEAIRAAVESQSEGVPCTVSIGVAAREPTERSPDQLIRRADRALYRAKRKGRNCVETAKPAHPGDRQIRG